jgi:hypothetical protein
MSSGKEVDDDAADESEDEDTEYGKGMFKTILTRARVLILKYNIIR